MERSNSAKKNVKNDDRANRKRAKRKKAAGTFAAATNFILAFLLLCVGTACLYDYGEDTLVSAEEGVYRYGDRQSNGVSLMFNVYQNTDAVYEILEILQKEGAKATFFVGGCWADDNGACLNAIKSAGHETGNHGYFHKDQSALSLKDNVAEISRCNRLIEALTGEKPALFAPPSGAYGKNTLSAAADEGMKVVLWTKDTVDWRDQNASLIFRRATEDIRGGDFVLMHPTAATVSALGDVLAYYRTHSLRAVSVSDNLAGG